MRCPSCGALSQRGRLHGGWGLVGGWMDAGDAGVDGCDAAETVYQTAPSTAQSTAPSTAPSTAQMHSTAQHSTPLTQPQGSRQEELQRGGREERSHQPPPLKQLTTRGHTQRGHHLQVPIASLVRVGGAGAGLALGLNEWSGADKQAPIRTFTKHAPPPPHPTPPQSPLPTPTPPHPSITHLLRHLSNPGHLADRQRAHK